MAIFVKLNIIAVAYCTNNNYGWLYVVPSTIILSVALLIFFVVPLKINGNQNYKYAFYMKFLGPITCIVLNFFKITGDDQKFYDMMMMVIYYIVFYTQGVFDQCYTP